MRLLDVVCVRDYPVSLPNSQIARDVAHLLDVPVTTFGAISDYDATSSLGFWCAHFRAWAIASAVARKRSKPSRRHYVAFHIPGVEIRRVELEDALPNLLLQPKQKHGKATNSSSGSTSTARTKGKLRRRPLMVLATSSRDTLAYTCSTSELQRMCRPDSLASYLACGTRITNVCANSATTNVGADSTTVSHSNLVRRHTLGENERTPSSLASTERDDDVGYADVDERKVVDVDERKVADIDERKGILGADNYVAGGVRVDEDASKRELVQFKPEIDGRYIQRAWNLLSDRVIHYSTSFVHISFSHSVQTVPPRDRADTDRVTKETMTVATEGVDPRVCARQITMALATAIQPPFRYPCSSSKRRTTRLRDRIRQNLDVVCDSGSSLPRSVTSWKTSSSSLPLSPPTTVNTSQDELSTLQADTPTAADIKHRACAYLATWAYDTLHDTTWATYFVELASSYATQATLTPPSVSNHLLATDTEQKDCDLTADDLTRGVTGTPVRSTGTPVRRGSESIRGGEMKCSTLTETRVPDDRRLRKNKRDGRWAGCVLTLYTQAQILANVNTDWDAAARLLQNAKAHGPFTGFGRLIPSSVASKCSTIPTMTAQKTWLDELMTEYQVAVRSASALGVVHETLRCEWHRLRADTRPLKRAWRQFDKRVQDVIHAGLPADATAFEAIRFQFSLGSWRKEWVSPSYWNVSPPLQSSPQPPSTPSPLPARSPPPLSSSFLSTPLASIVVPSEPSITLSQFVAPLPSNVVSGTTSSDESAPTAMTSVLGFMSALPTLAIWCGHSERDEESWDFESVIASGYDDNDDVTTAIVNIARELAAYYRVTVFAHPRPTSRSWPTDNPRLVSSTSYNARDYTVPSPPSPPPTQIPPQKMSKKDVHSNVASSPAPTPTETSKRTDIRNMTSSTRQTKATSDVVTSQTKATSDSVTGQTETIGDTIRTHEKFDVMIVCKHVQDVSELVSACRQMHIWVHDMPSVFGTQQLVDMCQQHHRLVRSVMFVSQHQARRYFPVSGVSSVPRSAQILFPKLVDVLSLTSSPSSSSPSSSYASMSADARKTHVTGTEADTKRMTNNDNVIDENKRVQSCPASDRDSLQHHKMFVTCNGIEKTALEHTFLNRPLALSLSSSLSSSSVEAAVATDRKTESLVGSRKIAYKCVCMIDGGGGGGGDLAVLLCVWSAVRARFPEATLDVYRMHTKTRERNRKLVNNSRMWRHLGVRDRGMATSKTIAQSLESATYWMCPTPRENASCMDALKASAARCVPVYISGGVLGEVFADGYACESVSDYEALVLRAMTDAVTSPELHRKMLDANHTRVCERHLWSDIAKRWYAHFQTFLKPDKQITTF
jgi:hypothetical protein